ncbi:cellulase family glycosylhydrolase [Stieleria varia]|uniref:Cellulase (Glycosyl hydrolase family 5) n=1 Tax=Stieleria varia TaxID=2528005 RepID=A0A5C6A2L7_9BACT|nr:cellulase family glycosylhydrolase [Stieleria varia]TWT92693.1 Cellulase (glycosyl hydrolase family 5) [Stieleria varia]
MYQTIAYLFSIYFSATAGGVEQPDYAPLRVRVSINDGMKSVRGAHEQVLRGTGVAVYKYRRDQLKLEGNWPANDYARSAAYYDELVERNINAVRVICFDPWQRSHADPGSTVPYPYADLNDPDDVAELLSDLDRIVELCEQRDIYVLINYHDTTGYRDPDHSSPAGSNGQFAYLNSMDYLNQFWDIVGPRYADRKHVFYELTNEPVGYHPNDYNSQHLDDFAALYHRVRVYAPETHLAMLSFTTVASYGASMLDVTNQLKQRGVKFTNASVGFHPYKISSLPHSLTPINQLRAAVPVINTEQNFPLSVDDGVDDPNGRGFGGDLLGTQTMERLGISWFHWNTTGPEEFNSNFRGIVLPDARDKGYLWRTELRYIMNWDRIVRLLGFSREKGAKLFRVTQ